MISLKNSIEHLPELKNHLKNVNSNLLISINEKIDELKDMYTLIDEAIVDDPPMTIKEGGIIKKGYSKEIDEYKEKRDSNDMPTTLYNHIKMLDNVGFHEIDVLWKYYNNAVYGGTKKIIKED
jgi:DNA mismatch repair protein MutS